MRWNPVPLAGGSYADSARPWTWQETVNWLPVKAERAGARSDALLRDVPGLRPLVVAGTGPIRGAHNAEGKLFVVSGQELYQISTSGIAILIGAIPGVGRVQIAHNQIEGGNEVEVVNGTSGYVYNTVTDTLTQITDEGFPGAKSTRFLGQKLLQVEPFGRFWFESEVNAATSYNSIFRYPAEGAPDLILHVEPSQGEALVFGNRTIEVWAENVTETASFQRGTLIERGAASAHAIVTLDNSCIFLGNDGIVYRLNGYTPVPISHRPLEGSLAGLDLSKSFAFTWEDRGHKVAYFTIHGGQTWGYDIPQGEWHRRESYGLARWRLNTLTQWNGMWVGGDFADGTLWELDWDYHKEGCDELVRKRRPPVMHDSANRISVHAVRIEADTGQEPTAAAAAPPTITGSLPDGTADDVVSYQYTITLSYPGQEYMLTATGLPTGLTITHAGLVEGTLQVSGDFVITLTTTNNCGETFTLEDPVTVADNISSAILEDAPILYWKLNETSGTTAIDYSGFERDGTIVGAPTLSSSGVTLTTTSQGVFFSGSLSGSPLDVGIDTTWSIEAVLTRNGDGGSVRESIAGQVISYSFGTVNSILALDGSSEPSDLGKPFGAFTNSVGSGLIEVKNAAALSNAVRTHLMIVRDPGSGGTGALRLYINGTEAATNTTFNSSNVANPSDGGDFHVGGHPDHFPSSYGLIGKVEHVAVYDTAVTAARALYHAQLLGLA